MKTENLFKKSNIFALKHFFLYREILVSQKNVNDADFTCTNLE